MLSGIQSGWTDYNPFYEETLSEIEREYEELLPEVATNEMLHERETLFISYLTNELLSSPEENWNRKEIQTARNLLTVCAKVLKERNEPIDLRSSHLLAKLHKFDIDEALEKNEGDLFHKLGYLYLMGTMGIRDIEDAVKLFGWGAAKSNVPSLYNLGLCFMKGIGVSKDEKRGFELMIEALEAGGDSNVYHCLGRCYELGVGTEKNEENSFECYEAAALDREHCAAMYDLGRCYERGFGTKTSIENALIWYQLAAEKGHVGASQAIERIKSMLNI